MSRATGASAQVLVKAESSYGVDPGGNYVQAPFVPGVDLGMEQGLLADPVLGNGRDPRTPFRDAKNVGGAVPVPIDYRNIGLWLGSLLGAPTTSQPAATGTITFADNPTAEDTITLNGVTWTFKSSGASGDETNIQGDLAATLAQLVSDLNGSADTDIDDATYTENDTQLIITHDTAGAAGNSYTLAASADTVSGATLTGGGYRHRYQSGDNTLPSLAVEVGHPNIPAYFLNLGCAVGSMNIDFQRTGAATAVFDIIGQDEQKNTSSQGGTPVSLDYDAFSGFQGLIKRNGTAYANIVSAVFNYNNNLDPVAVIRSDGLIAGVDPGLAECTGTLTARFDSVQLYDDAVNDTELELQFGFSLNAHTQILFTVHNARLPIVKQPIEGPGGIQASFDWRGAYDAAESTMLTVDLHNDYDGTVYPS